MEDLLVTTAFTTTPDQSGWFYFVIRRLPANQTIGRETLQSGSANCFQNPPGTNWLHLVVRHQEFRQYFRESFAKILALKIESFRNFVTIFKISAKLLFQIFDI